jgi:hypothetical protein
MPFHEGPLPKELDRLFANNVAALVFPAGSWKKDEVVIRVGRWRPGGQQFYCSEYIPASDLESLLNVVQQAHEKYAPECKASARGR